MTGTYAGQFVMEGFLDFTLPIWQRVLLTRSIAIIPALMISFVSPDTLTGMDDYLNILQALQLPFALVPLIKFVGNKKIMGDFAVSKWQIGIASFLGTSLFLMNFVLIFKDFTWDLLHILPTALISIIYLTLISITIYEPVQDLQKMTKAE